ncbi:DNA alkylation repair protein [Dongia mobilis]|uniref:DNA alkylation repair protein n=1 Tax=Dongia sp. TaxID=1977262 RepID=UPI0026E94AB7
MAEPLKEIFNATAVGWLAERLKGAWPDFPVARFKKAILAELPDLELKARIERIALEMQRQLPPDFRKSVQIVTRALGAPPPAGDGTDFGNFRAWACHRYVSLAGLDHADLALDYFARATRHFSAEFDIRPFIQRDQDHVLDVMRQWAADDDWRLRRLASEGARPRLPWGLRLTGLVTDPEPLFPILEALRDDPIEAVRRSVANNLNDIAKDHPDLLVAYVKPWLKAEARAPLVRHALRHLVKQGHGGALSLMGVDHTADLRVTKLTLDAKRVSIGGSIGISATLANAGATAAFAIVDYAVHHLGARGEARPKVFKWTTLTVAPGATVTLARRHSLKPVTTRRYYPGGHFLDLRINGRVLAKQGFALLAGQDSDKNPAPGTFSGRYRG